MKKWLYLIAAVLSVVVFVGLCYADNKGDFVRGYMHPPGLNTVLEEMQNDNPGDDTIMTNNAMLTFSTLSRDITFYDSEDSITLKGLLRCLRAINPKIFDEVVLNIQNE